MSAAAEIPQSSRRPRTLFGRLTLILLLGLVLAHALSFSLVFYERSVSSMTMMLGYLAKDIASGIAILERVPADERIAWLERLERKNYRYTLARSNGEETRSELVNRVRDSVAETIGPSYIVSAHDNDRQPSLHLQLRDGTPLSIALSLSLTPLAPWMLLLLALQLILLVIASLIAVKLATRPLAQLAAAANALRPSSPITAIDETGPIEVVQAAAAFNAMQRRIADYMNERMRMLAAISHDLQTPITRMHLRTELLEDIAIKSRFTADLNAMQQLVREGIAYARDGQGITEIACRTDLNSLLESIVYDYKDAGVSVLLTGRAERIIVTRPQTLRRVVGNLVDNALKFAGDVEIAMTQAPNHVNISVSDHGPGIHTAELNAVLQPFYRIENSRNRDTGGTGLGLAIAQQLAAALGGTLTLSNREPSGLQASISLPYDNTKPK